MGPGSATDRCKPTPGQAALAGGGVALAALGLLAFNLGWIGSYAAFLPLVAAATCLLVEVADDFFMPLLLLSVTVALLYAAGLFALPLTVAGVALGLPALGALGRWGLAAAPRTIRLDARPGWRTLELLGMVVAALFARYLVYRTAGGTLPLSLGQIDAIGRLVMGETVGWAVFAALFGLQRRARQGVPFDPRTDFAASFLSLWATGLFLISPHAVIMTLGLNLFGAGGLYVGALPAVAAHILTRTLTGRRREIERQASVMEAMAAERTRNERLVAIGQMSSAISHQILQQIGLLGIHCDVARDALAAAPPGEAVAEVGERMRQLDLVIEGLDATLSDLLVFSRDFELHLAPQRLSDLVVETLSELGGKGTAAGVSLGWTRVGEQDLLAFDRIKLKQAVLNLLANAVEASPAGGRVAVELDVSRPDSVRLSVRDEGPGIAPEHMESILSPFFSTKERGKGLGLTFARKIVDLHGGSLAVSNNRDGGCTFVIELPRREAGRGVPLGPG